MCGICFVYSESLTNTAQETIDSMVSSLQHRGPDAQNTYLKDQVALGHSRLSIVDIRGGTQPMQTSDGRYAITYNGELYNFKELKDQLKKKGVEFSTQSDTEVVLQMYAQYGKESVSYLRGMFAFAIYDNAANSLFIVRDRLGIKPLFYHWNNGTLVGGSEIKSIFASGLVEPILNLHSIANFFNYQFSVSPCTPFENILELEPGYTMFVSDSQPPEISQYWDLEFPRDGDYESLEESEWQIKFQDSLDDAVVCHMIGDVPIGSYLSGGIDSATTTYMLSKHYDNPVQSFTIQFTNTSQDESEIARLIADHINVPNSAMVLDDDRPVGYLQELIAAIYHLEQPQRVAVDIPHFMLSEFVRKQNYKVVYTGDGADELLGGYECFRRDAIRTWGNQCGIEGSREELYYNAYKEYYARDYIRLLSEVHSTPKQQSIINQYGCFPVWYDTWQVLSETGQNLFTSKVKESLKDNYQMETLVSRMKPQLEGRHWLNQSLYIESKTRLSNWILWKSDRLSMSHSVEARVPFMDHKLVEVVAQIPPELKLNGMDEKYLLKKIMLEHMPQHPQQFKKRAFYSPIREWFFTSEKIKSIDAFINRDAISKAGVFEYESVMGLIDAITKIEVPQSHDDYYALMKLEWGLMLVLTVQILHWLFIEKNAACFRC